MVLLKKDVGWHVEKLLIVNWVEGDVKIAL
jgi:hypothetical protein